MLRDTKLDAFWEKIRNWKKLLTAKSIKPIASPATLLKYFSNCTVHSTSSHKIVYRYTSNAEYKKVFSQSANLYKLALRDNIPFQYSTHSSMWIDWVNQKFYRLLSAANVQDSIASATPLFMLMSQSVNCKANLLYRVWDAL